MGLRENLGCIEIRLDDGGIYDITVGESSRKDWYNKKSGRLYISHFKTNKSKLRTPYDFYLKNILELKNAIDHTLRPDHPQVDRKCLVGVGVDKIGMSASVGEKTIMSLSLSVLTTHLALFLLNVYMSAWHTSFIAMLRYF